MNSSFKNNESKSRFELEVSGEIAFADYKITNGVVYINHVEAPIALRGTGAASTLMQELMTQIRRDKLKVVPICGYAAKWINTRDEFQDMLAK